MKNRRGSVETPGLDVLGPIQELFRQLRNGTLAIAQVQEFVEHRNPFGDAVGAFVALRDWEKFYLDVFGLKKDFSGLVIPPHQHGFDRLLVVAEGMTPNRLFEACEKLFPCWRYKKDLDVIKSERATDHDYAVWVRNRREADEELKDLSAKDLGEQGVVGITIEERLLYELKFSKETWHKETDKHLDIANWTLCAGSRNLRGDVPCVYRDPVRSEMCVGWCNPFRRREDLRARAVVSA